MRQFHSLVLLLLSLPDSFAVMADPMYLADIDIPVVRLEIKPHFDNLTDKEKAYAHHFNRASWLGRRIIADQLSHDASKLYNLIIGIFTSSEGQMRDIEHLKKYSNLGDDTFLRFLEYSAQVLANIGQYRSFGDTKFIPRIPVDDIRKIVEATGSESAGRLLEECFVPMYNVTPEAVCRLGFPADGHVSGYYSDNVSKADIESVQKVLESENISALNTRLFKSTSDPKSFEVRIASANTRSPTVINKDGLSILLVYGDFSKEMSQIAVEIRAAAEVAANETQKQMCLAYAKSFETGSIEEHKESQIHWVRDQNPTVETNIGFIETYRDPAGVRAEWEGFVAVVNKEMTKKFGVLVSNAQEFISMLPWPAEFEKDTFLRPDFTSLEVLSFATGGLPAGINIPNYDDIRQKIGFKNVSLGNVLNAHSPNEKMFFLSETDKELFAKYRGPAFEVQVGLHELLGHGSGKLLAEESPDVFNFDHANPPISPLTGKPITTWYKPGQTWGSVFKGVSSSYEECRAETVAMHLMLNMKVLSIFGHEGQEAEDIIYVGYLAMAKAGLQALEFYDPVTKKWGQAHMQARFALLKVFLAAELAEVNTADDDVLLVVHRDRIRTHGAPAVANFLTALQVYKATGDAEQGTDFYIKSTSVEDSWLPIRDIVLRRKQARKVFVQCNTFMNADGSVGIKEYPSTLEGLIQSHVERGV